ncbi:hypothetical protein JHK87_045120 [Glycine soja]|nr:hypothetical protein JHK87_045120 [Glycine soja]
MAKAEDALLPPEEKSNKRRFYDYEVLGRKKPRGCEKKILNEDDEDAEALHLPNPMIGSLRYSWIEPFSANRVERERYGRKKRDELNKVRYQRERNMYVELRGMLGNTWLVSRSSYHSMPRYKTPTNLAFSYHPSNFKKSNIAYYCLIPLHTRTLSSIPTP